MTSLCVLCLAQSGSVIAIFSDEGFRLNICETINKHFWLELNSTDDKVDICLDCWQNVYNFNEFYQRVYHIHEQRRSHAKSVPIEFFGEIINPLSQPAELVDALSEGIVSSNEVKVEVSELELLPKVEVFEDSVDAKIIHAAKRFNFCQESNAPSKKRVKNEKATIDYDSDEDIPLADYLTTELKTETINPSTSALDSKRRRSLRTRKVNGPSPKPIIKNEFETENEQDVNDFITSDITAGTDDSGSSSVGSDADSVDSLPDIEPEERFAEIPKRIVVKPKKYRKRPKPLVPPARRSREEAELRKSQQLEYDDIIVKFFKKLPCHICNLLVQNFGDMRRHQRLTHKLDPGYMMCCGRKFMQRKSLADHVLVHWNPDHFKCKQCERIFQDSRALEVHEQAHSNPQVQPKSKRMFQCEKCPKSYTTKAAVEYHIVSKHVPKSDFKFTCPECNKRVPTERKLKEHLKYMHDPETAIICDKCGKTLRSQANLKKHHELEHSDEPRPKPDPVQCEICGTWLRHLYGLKQHLSSVHEPPGGDHRCPICNKISTNSRALKRHIYHNHECERKFKCTMCEKAFKRPQDLREHTSTHTGEVLYTCPNCPMTFFSNANMYKHRQRLHRAEWEADRKKPLPPNQGKKILKKS